MVSILDKTHVNCKHLPFFVVFFTFLDWHGTFTSRGYLISPQSKFGSLSDFERLLSKDQDDLTANFTSKNTDFLKLVRMCVRFFFHLFPGSLLSFVVVVVVVAVAETRCVYVCVMGF